MQGGQVDIKSFKGLTLDSRSVKEGYLFAAVPGAKTDGRKFIDDAIRKGARGVLAPTGTVLPEGTNAVLMTDDNPRRAFALIAAEFYGRQPKTIMAVTGTNGKTSTVHFIKQLWKSQGIRAASIGTLGVRGPEGVRSWSMTTPDPVSLHAELADMAAAGIDHLAMEASSHGLDQFRLDGVKVAAAGFTNLSRDHLDYHPDMQHYFQSKGRLFSDILLPGGAAVLNADVPEFKVLEQVCAQAGRKIISYGYKGADLKIMKLKPAPGGQDLAAQVFGHDYHVTIPLVGEFQVLNALCALGLVLSEFPDEVQNYIAALEKLTGVPGRLQLVPGHPRAAAVYIDYAHTPDALENILKSLRPHTKKRLVCLFGCGGDRDAGKRPIMGKIAAKHADGVIVTDDNPRSEEPAEIRAAILKTARKAVEISGRREAIRAAVQSLEKGDVLVIAGKGHEQGQIFATHTDPFDDFTEARKAMEELTA